MEDPTDGVSVKEETPLEEKKFGGTSPAIRRGKRAYEKRCEDVRKTLTRLDENLAWDSIQARDLPPDLIAFVESELVKGVTPGQLCKVLGLNRHGGKNSRQWRKIQAYIRQGFRADAEGYLFRMTHDFFETMQKAKTVLDDAFENGVPIVEQTKVHDRDGGFKVETQVHYVKGATKELGSFLESYGKAVMLPMKMWREYGAIGEQQSKGSSPGGITIVVKTNVPTPTQAQVDSYRDRMLQMDPPIDVTKESSVKPQS